MSAEGLRNAQWIRRVQPRRAAILAAELRNAVTPASVVAQDLVDLETEWDGGGACCAICGGDPAASHHGHSQTCPIGAAAASIQDTVRHVLALADALQPPPLHDPGSKGWLQIAAPDRDSSGGHTVLSGRRYGKTLDSLMARIAELEAERDALLASEGGSEGQHRINVTRRTLGARRINR